MTNTTTLPELKERLKEIDEITLLEMFEISSEDIIECFNDRIENKYQELIEDYANENIQTRDEDV